jgi:hypothetical protein
MPIDLSVIEGALIALVGVLAFGVWSNHRKLVEIESNIREVFLSLDYLTEAVRTVYEMAAKSAIAARAASETGNVVVGELAHIRAERETALQAIEATLSQRDEMVAVRVKIEAHLTELTARLKSGEQVCDQVNQVNDQVSSHPGEPIIERSEDSTSSTV